MTALESFALRAVPNTVLCADSVVVNGKKMVPVALVKALIQSGD